MKAKKQESIDASASLATTGTELMIPSGQVPEREKNADIVTIDYPAQEISRRGQVTSVATGPRTEIGKQNSSRNAIRHGIFSESTLLKGESRAESVTLSMQLWEALRPEGRLEELLVDKLASLSWRYRRLLLAETGEIRKQVLEWNQHSNEQDEKVLNSLRDEDRLISYIQDPHVLKRCLELLGELREAIETGGFDQKRDGSILQKLYGTSTYTQDRLREEYSVWVETAQAPEEERVRDGLATHEECKQNVLYEIDEEIRRLKASHKRRVTVESQQNEIELLQRSVPPSEWMDRVLRYEASLERGFDRTLGQLERLQRLRLGQPVAPRIDVSISG